MARRRVKTRVVKAFLPPQSNNNGINNYYHCGVLYSARAHNNSFILFDFPFSFLAGRRAAITRAIVVIHNAHIIISTRRYAYIIIFLPL